MPEFLTPPQAARVLGVQPHKVLAFIRRGDLKAADISLDPSRGRPRWRIRREDLDAFLDSRSQKPQVDASLRKRRARSARDARTYY